MIYQMKIINFLRSLGIIQTSIFFLFKFLLLYVIIFTNYIYAYNRRVREDKQPNE